MPLQIGRVGFGPVLLDEPEVWDWSGETVQVSGEFYAATIHDTKALKQQLLGHVNNPDEPVVPVTWTEDSHADGFYRVLSAEVGSVAGSYFAAGWFPFSCTLQRIPDYAAPLIESILLGPTVRTNGESVVESRGFHALPAAVTGYRVDPTSFTPTEVTFSTPDGNVTNRWAAPSVGSDYRDATAAYMLPAADWYDGSALLELDYIGTQTTYRTAVGRQIPNIPGDGRWRISNGIIRMELTSTTQFIVGVSRWTGSAWTTAKDFFFGDFDGASTRLPFVAPSSITVVRNSPEEVVVRFGAKTTAASLRDVTVEVGLQRGCSWFTVRLASPYAMAGQGHTIGRNTNEAWSILAATVTNLASMGIKATAADAGYKYVLAAETLTGLATSPLALVVSDLPLSSTFMLGMSEDSGAAEAPLKPEGQVLAWLAAQSETVRVVER